MPSCGFEKDWRAIKAKREKYRQKLIAKGVLDGSNKMRALMARKGL